MKSTFFLVFSIVLGAIGQVLFKKGVNAIDAEGWRYYFALLTNLPIALGFLCYGGSFVLWLGALRYFDVSVARPYTSLGYIITYVFAILMLGETFSFRRGIAIGLITAGVFLLR